jgi:hypothetical protein
MTMAKEQVRSASKTLSPLLRRRGTSPEVGSALRRTLQALDKAMAAPEGQEVPDEIRQALAELRGCLVFIHESTRPADQEQLEGAAKALSFLAPLEAGLPAPPAEPSPALPQGPSVFQTVVPSNFAPPPVSAAPPRRARTERKRRTQSIPAVDVGTVEVQLGGLHGCFDTLHAVLTGIAHRRRDLDSAANTLRAHLRAIGWLGRERTPAWVKASREAPKPERRLVASAALVYLEAPGGAERSMTVLERAAQGENPLSPIAVTVMHTLAGQHFLACARTVFEKTKSETVRALLLPLLVERGQLTSAQLLPLVDHTDDGVAIEAALALAQIGDGQHAEVLTGHASRAKDRRRSNALLFAATALGSVQALAEVRTRLREECDERLVDALAIAGDDADAPLLIDLASRPDANATYAILAAANLGCTTTVRALLTLAELAPKAVIDEAARMILGNRPLPSSSEPRLLRGQPWSVAGLLARLAAGDETIPSQRRLALELRVRTGLAPQAVLPSFASAEARSEALARWADHFAKASARLPAGQWYYQGKPAKLARKGLA